MRLNILILDDDPNKDRIPAFKKKFIGNNVVWVQTAPEAIELLDKAEPSYWDAIFLDHDLGGQAYVPSGPGTGYEVAKWLESHPDKKPKQIFLHSLNPVGRDNMKAALPEAEHAPWAWK